MKINIDAQAKGVRIITGDETRQRRILLNKLIFLAEEFGCEEIILPSIEPANIYTNKAGDEILGKMYSFTDINGLEICLRPEATATIQLIADKYYRDQKDVKLWYFEKCWRYEKQQEGRYHEFHQFGVEVINPSNLGIDKEIMEMGLRMVRIQTQNCELLTNVKRGLDYYTKNGFEVIAPDLGSQKVVLGGGRYEQGIGFSLGFERLMLLNKEMG